MGHWQTAKKVREHKEKHPELYCPKCLWRTGGGYCPRHTVTNSMKRLNEAVHAAKETQTLQKH